MRRSCRGIETYQVDAFTDRPFTGNPAAVCLLDSVLPGKVMRLIAAEMNLSETAFLVPLDGDFMTASRFRLRWFTPLVEVPLCGHATLASAAVLFQEKANRGQILYFETKSGTLSARREGLKLMLDFPANPPHPFPVPAGILDGLGLSGPLAGWLSKEAEMLLLPLPEHHDVVSLKPDFAKLMSVSERGCIQGLIVTSRGPEGFDFCSRYFGPWEGIDEDPVTGSAHTVLAPYWAGILEKNRFRAFQASRRSGILDVQLQSDLRVELAGLARVVLKGELYT